MKLGQAQTARFQRVSWTPVTGSTNADLLKRASEFPDEAEVLFTDEQTAGRGRRDRRWDMVAGGGLLVSFYVPWTSPEEAHAIPTALGVAAIEAIAMMGRQVWLKWPNDIIAPDNRKVAGMLSETVVVDGCFVGVIIGLGCNVSWPDPSVAAELPNAVSLDRLGDDPVDRTKLAVSLVEAFDRELDGVQARGVGQLQDRYRARCRTIGSMVRIDQGDTVVTGQATDVSVDGALLVSIDGVQRRVDVGDVVHLRVVDPTTD